MSCIAAFIMPFEVFLFAYAFMGPLHYLTEISWLHDRQYFAKGKYDSTSETDQQVVERVAELAKEHGVPRTHIALAWLLQKEPVTAPIVGATKISHLEEAVGALSLKLTQDEVAFLEEPYLPHRIVGHQ